MISSTSEGKAGFAQSSPQLLGDTHVLRSCPCGKGQIAQAQGGLIVLTLILLKSFSSENATELRAMCMEAGVGILKTVSVSA